MSPGPVPSTTGTLKVGVLSLAHVHAATYVSLLTAMPGIDVLVTDPDAALEQSGALRGEALATALNVTYASTYDEVLAWGPDAVVICAENTKHRALIERVAEHQIPILCEKPLATTTADAQAIVALCDATNTPLMVALPIRFHPSFRALRALVDRGELGAIVSISSVNNGRAPVSERSWFLQPEHSGGGCVMDHTVHCADLFALLLGSEPVDVYAQANAVIHAETTALETGGLVTITYANGVVATIDCSWSVPEAYPTWGGLSMTVECERGTATFDAFSDRLDVYSDFDSSLRWVDFGGSCDEMLLDTFLHSVRTASPAQPDQHVGLRTVQIVSAAYESIATGQPAHI
jgi:1,5-anhydro-D-fructose reductase (1,5-anhydro-D-mannitol-forming)